MDVVRFSKYHGLGNDFIILDNMKDDSDLSELTIREMCCRQTGIGGDGVIILHKSSAYNFKFSYFNADGKIGSLCGNGARCAIKYAKERGIVSDNNVVFEAVDGVHSGQIDSTTGLVTVRFLDIHRADIKQLNISTYCLDTGSPHHVSFVEDVKTVDVVSEGKKIRYSSEYMDTGVNVNFVEIRNDNSIYVRTYERGVENETAACGTGCVAAAISFFIKEGKLSECKNTIIKAYTKNGHVAISFSACSKYIYNLSLDGPAIHVYDGIMPKSPILNSKIS